MAQLRNEYDTFVSHKAEVLAAGPEKPEAFKRYWQKHRIPFVGLPDPKHSILKLYGQQVNLFKLGRMPAQVIVDRRGWVRFVHYGHSMRDIPQNTEIFMILESLNSEDTD
jgi:peroxiredoxin Q/BCP